MYKNLNALHENQFNTKGFEWVDLSHRSESIMVYKRKGFKPKDDVLVILNMTSVPRFAFEITVKNKSKWKEVFNSDSVQYWGTGDVYNPKILINVFNKEDKLYKLRINLPPLGGIILK
jgi:1,4-alpha-glucan branching enzyme